MALDGTRTTQAATARRPVVAKERAQGIPVLAGLCLWPCKAVQAQSAGPREAPFTLTASTEVRRDRTHCHFDEPSLCDTPFVVPHFFEQDYVADNNWLVLRADFGGRRLRFQTEGGLASWGTGTGHDYDTFFQPDGDVIVYGTTAVTQLRSFRMAQRVECAGNGWLGWRAGYAFRRDRAFFEPSDSITTHTQPKSESRFFNTGRDDLLTRAPVRSGANGSTCQRGMAAGCRR